MYLRTVIKCMFNWRCCSSDITARYEFGLHHRSMSLFVHVLTGPGWLARTPCSCFGSCSAVLVVLIFERPVF